MSAIENTFGHGARIHPVTKRPLEQGIGHLSDDHQALLHIEAIRHEDGDAIADAMLAELKATKDKVAADKHLEAVEHEAETVEHTEEVHHG